MTGVASETLGEIEARLQADVIDENPDIAVIQGGINDIITAGSDPNGAMRTAIQNMVTDLINASIPFVLVNLSAFKGHALWTADRQTWFDSYNDWLENTLAIPNGYEMVDAEAVLDTNADDILDPGFDFGDGLHYSVAGNIEIAKAYGAGISNEL